MNKVDNLLLDLEAILEYFKLQPDWLLHNERETIENLTYAIKNKVIFICPKCGCFEWHPIGTGFCSRKQCNKCGESI